MKTFFHRLNPLFNLVFSPLLAILVLCPFSVFCASLTDLQSTKYGELTSALTEIEQKKRLLKQDLLVELNRVRQQSVKLGFLERIEAVDREIFSLIFDQPLISEPSSDGEISRTRATHSKQLQHTEALRARTIVNWFDNYIIALDELIQNFVSAGNNLAAKEAKLNKEAITNSKLITLAQATTKQEEANQETEAPGFDTKWLRLNGIEYTAEGGKYFNYDRTTKKDKVLSYKGISYTGGHHLHNHSNGKYIFQFSKPVTGFKATGCIEARSRKGNVIFSVKTQEQGEVYRSKAVHSRRRGESIEVSFNPTKSLTIEVLPNGEGSEDWGFWLNPSVSVPLEEVALLAEPEAIEEIIEEVIEEPQVEEKTIASAEPQLTKAPEETAAAKDAAKNYLTILSEEKFDDVPKLFHPDAAKEFGELTNQLFDLPKEQAESFGSILFGDDSDIQKLKQATDGERYAVFITGMQKRFAGMPGLSQAYKTAQILGEIQEGPTTHVLARLVMGNFPAVETFEIFSFKKHEGEWKLLMSAKAKKPLFTIARMLK